MDVVDAVGPPGNLLVVRLLGVGPWSTDVTVTVVPAEAVAIGAFLTPCDTPTPTPTTMATMTTNAMIIMTIPLLVR